LVFFYVRPGLGLIFSDLGFGLHLELRGFVYISADWSTLALSGYDTKAIVVLRLMIVLSRYRILSTNIC